MAIALLLGSASPATADRGGHARVIAPRGGHALELTDPIDIGRELAAQRGWTGPQWGCLVRLWSRESGWRPWAHNRSGAHGIPQALPGSKMARFGADWLTSPWTQIRWGLWYVAQRYGSPCAALEHSYAHNFY